MSKMLLWDMLMVPKNGCTQQALDNQIFNEIALHLSSIFEINLFSMINKNFAQSMY